jgi:secreted trypsin-like serine protease
MGLFRIVVLLAIIFALLELSQVATGLETKVTGGNTAYQGQFPYQVRLYIATKTGSAYICGAAIISPHVLLSAADCFYGLNLNYVQVIAGNIYTDISFAGQQIAYVAFVTLVDCVAALCLQPKLLHQ